jgi:hypothetical protein
MKKLLLLILLSNAQAQQFNGTVFDLETGRIQVISGSFSQTGDWKTDALLQIRENQIRWAAQQEMQEQTRLLRQIANQ